MNTVVLTKRDVHRGNLILVNSDWEYQEISKDSLLPVREGFPVLLQRRAVTLLSSLMEEIRGWKQIVPVSGYRSYEEQQEIWDGSLQENGRAFTEKFVALPGHSEHQTGLAIDLGLKQEKIDFICPDFPYSGICQRFRERAGDYGFVERYPAGKEAVTGIGHEPWHFRYVGMPHGAIMSSLGLVLEEYLDFLKEYVYEERPYRYERGGAVIEVSYLPCTSEGVRLGMDEGIPYSFSGNNMDGYIITKWCLGGKGAVLGGVGA